MTYEDIKKANESIIKTKLKNEKTGKELGDYAEVNERIKVFRMLFPEGFIKTELLKLENGFCLIKAKVGYYKAIAKIAEEVQYIGDIEEITLATGTAYEKENSTFINKTSYIENCETSAVGRALAMLGIGIDKSVASAEEVANAILNQDEEVNEETARAYTFGGKKHPGETIEEIYEKEDIKFLQWCLDSEKTTEFVKKAIELLTPLKRTYIPATEEEQIKRLDYLQKIKMNCDIEAILEKYQVKDLNQLTTKELEEIANG